MKKSVVFRECGYNSRRTTKDWEVRSASPGENILGYVSWSNGRRSYVLHSSAWRAAGIAAGQLIEIAQFCGEQTAVRNDVQRAVSRK